MNTIVMVHGVGGTAEAFSRLAPAFRGMGWRVETPTLRPDKRLAENPPADLKSLRLKDYVDDIETLATALEAETGVAPVLFGHSMGGLVVQKLAERGVGRAAVLITPASPADARVRAGALAQAFTFANVLLSGKPDARSHKIWRTGFSWGVLNRVPKARHAGIFAGTVHDSGGVYSDIAYPDRDPSRTAFIDETRIRVPILVIGGGRDRATPVAGVRKVAEKYARVGGDYREYPENAHWIVDEPGTDVVIADIATWLAAKGLSPTGKPAVKARAAARKTAAKPVKAAGGKPAAAAAKKVLARAASKPGTAEVVGKAAPKTPATKPPTAGKAKSAVRKAKSS